MKIQITLVIPLDIYIYFRPCAILAQKHYKNVSGAFMKKSKIKKDKRKNYAHN